MREPKEKLQTVLCSRIRSSWKTVGPDDYEIDIDEMVEDGSVQ